jgi:hypothetical protein
MLDIKTPGKGQMTPPMATAEQHRLGVKFNRIWGLNVKARWS